MSNFKIEELSGLVENTFYQLPKYNATPFLQDITRILSLNENADWQKVCLRLDPYEAVKYLSLKDNSAKLAADGRILMEYKSEDITLEKIDTALKARIPLTPAMIKRSKNIKAKLTNKFIYEKAYSKTLYGTPFLDFKWLTLWDKKGEPLTNFCKDKSVSHLNDMLCLRGIYLRLDNNHRNTLRKLCLSDMFWTVLNTVDERYKAYCKAWERTASPLDLGVKEYTAKSISFDLVEDKAKNDVYVGLLRMTNKLEQYYSMEEQKWKSAHCYIQALFWCLEHEYT